MEGIDQTITKTATITQLNGCEEVPVPLFCDYYMVMDIRSTLYGNGDKIKIYFVWYSLTQTTITKTVNPCFRCRYFKLYESQKS